MGRFIIYHIGRLFLQYGAIYLFQSLTGVICHGPSYLWCELSIILISRCKKMYSHATIYDSICHSEPNHTTSMVCQLFTENATLTEFTLSYFDKSFVTSRKGNKFYLIAVVHICLCMYAFNYYQLSLASGHL